MEQQKEIFWMVWRDGSLDSRCQHYTKESAETEAKRVAGLCPGSVVFVLEATAAYLLEPTQIKMIYPLPF